jgi:hypothetical protein
MENCNQSPSLGLRIPQALETGICANCKSEIYRTASGWFDISRFRHCDARMLGEHSPFAAQPVIPSQVFGVLDEVYDAVNRVTAGGRW